MTTNDRVDLPAILYETTAAMNMERDAPNIRRPTTSISGAGISMLLGLCIASDVVESSMMHAVLAQRHGLHIGSEARGVGLSEDKPSGLFWLAPTPAIGVFA